MIPVWQQFLEQQGARIANGSVVDFGEPLHELAGAQTGTVMADLSQLGLLAYRGEDTATFLQSQFTNDVRGLGQDGAQWNGYCSAKGRLLGNFLMWRDGADYCLQMSGDISASLLKRLSMFVLRAKVQGRDASAETVRLVIAGPQAPDAVTEAMGAIPQHPMQTLSGNQGMVVRVGGDKFVLSLDPHHAPSVWQTLKPLARPVGSAVWDWMRLANGIPMIVAATQDQFVPQMVNLEALGGVSFQKGCYPGQEIVARSQYLGKLKRRMLLAHLDAGNPAPGDALYSDDLPGQAVGTVANAAPAPGGGYDLLAVVQTESAAAHPVHWQEQDGPVLIFRPLPYTLS